MELIMNQTVVQFIMLGYTTEEAYRNTLQIFEKVKLDLEKEEKDKWQVEHNHENYENVPY
jgi:hypothetical protein